MLRLFFIIITICGISIAVNNGPHSSAGCPVFNQGQQNENPRVSPLYIRSRPSAGRVIGLDMHLEYPGLNNNPIHLDATRHHIISYSVLARFFNALLDRSRTTNDFRIFSRAILYLYQNNPPQGVDSNTTSALQHFINGLIEGQYNIDTDFDDAQRRLIRILQTIFVWMPGNIFIGPRQRHDDPSDGFEFDAEWIVGRNHFLNLRELYFLMMAYIQGARTFNDRGCVIPVNMDRIVQLIQNMEQTPRIYRYPDWMLDPFNQAVISWDGDLVPLNVVQEFLRQRRDLLHRDDQSCPRPFILKVTSLPDPYCILSELKIGAKIITAVL